MDMNKGSLKYAIDSQRAIEIYSNIPTDKKLYPIIFLKYKGDKVMITDNSWQKFVYKKMVKIQKKEKEDLKNNKEVPNKNNINSAKQNDKIERREYKKSNLEKIRENDNHMRERRGIAIKIRPGPRGRGGFRGRVGFRGRRGFRGSSLEKNN